MLSFSVIIVDTHVFFLFPLSQYMLNFPKTLASLDT